MSKQFLACAALVVGVAAISGCRLTYITEPVGEPWTLEQTKPLEGAWVNPDKEVTELEQSDVGFVNCCDDGKIYLAVVEFDSDERQYEATTVEVVLTRHEDHDFLFARGRKADGEYLFARVVTVDAGQFRYRWPDEDVFVKAVEADSTLGEIRGTRDEGDSNERHAVVNGDGEHLSTIIDRYGIDACFPPNKEHTLRRLKRAK